MFRNSGKLTSSMSSNSSSLCNKENLSDFNQHLPSLIEIKSKFDAEFRRFSIQRTETMKFDDFYKVIENFHKLYDIEFNIFYTDPVLADLLPINNDDNYAKAISSAKPILKLIIQRKGESWEHFNGVHSKKKNFLGNLGLNNLLPSTPNKCRPSISMPEDFRQVSAIIDVDIVPDTCRRVRLVKHGSDKPLGFYIRDGTSLRVTPNGIEKVPGIFISRLVPGGLAESTGLLAVNDEVLEVNCIQVQGKTLDQVTDMMVANSSNLIITIRPANQRNFTLPSQYSIATGSSYAGSTNESTIAATTSARNSVYRASQTSQETTGSRNDSVQTISDDEDEVKDHFSNSNHIRNTNSNNSSNGNKNRNNSNNISHNSDSNKNNANSTTTRSPSTTTTTTNSMKPASSSPSSTSSSSSPTSSAAAAVVAVTGAVKTTSVANVRSTTTTTASANSSTVPPDLIVNGKTIITSATINTVNVTTNSNTSSNGANLTSNSNGSSNNHHHHNESDDDSEDVVRL